MRSGAFLLSLGLLVCASTVYAQTGGGGGGGGSAAGTGCTGKLQGSTVGLSIRTGDNNYSTIQNASVPYVFGGAECQCAPTDPNAQIQMEIAVTGTMLDPNNCGAAEVWAGQGCDTYTTRVSTTNTVCKKLNASVTCNDFAPGANGGIRVEIPIQGDSLFKITQNTCPSTGSLSNSLYLIVYTNPANLDASCILPLNQYSTPPAAAASVGTSSGDGAVTVTWKQPGLGSQNPPIAYQVLCANADGTPISGSPTDPPGYSICLDGVLHRRAINTGGGTPGSGGTDDLGTGTSLDLSTAAVASDPALSTRAGAAPLATADMGGPDMSTASGPDMAPPPTGFEGLDPRFVCSKQYQTGGGNDYNARIIHLENLKTYHFKVLAIDRYGNVNASPTLDGMPQPVEDLYRRYRDAGGSASGFCFIATAAFGSYENRYVHVLRDFRDRVLLPRAWGRSFVDWYYAHSPPAAAYIAARGWARALVRVALWPVIGLAAAWLYLAVWQQLLLLAALGGLAVAWRRRRRRARDARPRAALVMAHAGSQSA